MKKLNDMLFYSMPRNKLIFFSHFQFKMKNEWMQRSQNNAHWATNQTRISHTASVNGLFCQENVFMFGLLLAKKAERCSFQVAAVSLLNAKGKRDRNNDGPWHSLS